MKERRPATFVKPRGSAAARFPLRYVPPYNAFVIPAVYVSGVKPTAFLRGQTESHLGDAHNPAIV